MRDIGKSLAPADVASDSTTAVRSDGPVTSRRPPDTRGRFVPFSEATILNAPYSGGAVGRRGRPDTVLPEPRDAFLDTDGYGMIPIP